jgi:hypothetical protein
LTVAGFGRELIRNVLGTARANGAKSSSSAGQIGISKHHNKTTKERQYMDSKKTKEKKHTIRETVEIQHQFTLQEYKSKSEELAQLMADVSLKKEAVKASAASAKAVIKELESQCSELGNQLRLGAESRKVPADVEFDRKNGMKTYRFADGPDKGKVIRKSAMDEDEFDKLPLPDQPEPKPGDKVTDGTATGVVTGTEPLPNPALMPEQAEEAKKALAEGK